MEGFNAEQLLDKVRDVLAEARAELGKARALTADAELASRTGEEQDRRDKRSHSQVLEEYKKLLVDTADVQRVKELDSMMIELGKSSNVSRRKKNT